MDEVAQCANEQNLVTRARECCIYVCGAAYFFAGIFAGIFFIKIRKILYSIGFQRIIQLHLSQMSAKFAQKPLRNQTLRGFFTTVVPKFFH